MDGLRKTTRKSVSVFPHRDSIPASVDWGKTQEPQPLDLPGQSIQLPKRCSLQHRVDCMDTRTSIYVANGREMFVITVLGLELHDMLL